MSLLCASERLPSNAAARSCDHLAHAYGNAVGHRDRERRYPSVSRTASLGVWHKFRETTTGCSC